MTKKDSFVFLAVLIFFVLSFLVLMFFVKILFFSKPNFIKKRSAQISQELDKKKKINAKTEKSSSSLANIFLKNKKTKMTSSSHASSSLAEYSSKAIFVEISDNSIKIKKDDEVLNFEMAKEIFCGQRIKKDEDIFQQELENYNKEGDHTMFPPLPFKTKTINCNKFKKGDKVYYVVRAVDNKLLRIEKIY